MTLTTEQRLERVDREVEELKRRFVATVAQIQELDASFEERWAEIVRRLRRLRTELRPEDFDKGQLDELYRTVIDIPDLLDAGPNLEVCDELLVRIERIRHVVRDALDEHVDGIDDTPALVMDELARWLPTTSRQDLAELLGVDRRTLPRWARQTDRAPSRRLQTVARLVAILRHSWTEEGIVAWFHRPRRELDGRTPLEVLGDDKFDEDRLMGAARAGRSQYAT
jgi:uncharacterized protein (DUF2384 family)